MKAIHGPDNQADERAIASRVRPPAPADGPGAAGAAPTHAGDSRLAHGRAAAGGLMALQRAAGNAAVAALVGDRPAVQRAVTIEEISSGADGGGGTATTAQAGAAPVGTAGTASTAQAGPTGASGSPVTSDGGTTTITGGHITLAAPITESAGVIRADTIIADNVIGANYTPGAGNVW